MNTKKRTIKKNLTIRVTDSQRLKIEKKALEKNLTIGELIRELINNL